MSLLCRRHLLRSATALGLLALVAQHGHAAEQTLVVAYQTSVEPSKVPQAEGAYESATKAEIDWRKFDSGAEVIAAIAAGSVDIGYVGSSPLAAAASRQLPIETIFVVGTIGDSEALVARNGSGIASLADLKGKTIAVPFVSTTHYSLLAALDYEGVDPKGAEIINLRPPEIAAAFARGDIDAAYVWDPALGQIKTGGTVVLTSSKVAEWGAPTFDAWIVRKAFAQKHPDVVKAFVQTTGKAYAAYKANPAAWSAASPEAAKIARLSGAKVEDVPALLTGYVLPDLAAQASPEFLGGGTAAAIAKTSAFLKAQGKIDSVLSDYGPYVTTRFVTDKQAQR